MKLTHVVGANLITSLRRRLAQLKIYKIMPMIQLSVSWFFIKSQRILQRKLKTFYQVKPNSFLRNLSLRTFRKLTLHAVNHLFCGKKYLKHFFIIFLPARRQRSALPTKMVGGWFDSHDHPFLCLPCESNQMWESLFGLKNNTFFMQSRNSESKSFIIFLRPTFGLCSLFKIRRVIGCANHDIQKASAPSCL